MIKKILFGFALLASAVACTDDYTDWAQPQHNDQPEAVQFGAGSVTPVSLIDFKDIPEEQEKVQVCTISAPTSSDENYKPEYKLTIEGEDFDITEDGMMDKQALQDIIVSKFGKRPTERTLNATVSQWLNNGKTTVKVLVSEPFDIKALLVAPVVCEKYYLIGDFCDWSQDKMAAFNHSGKDVYDDPVFTVTVEFKYAGCWKIIPQSGVDKGDIWADAIGTKVDQDNSMSGFLSSSNPGAGKIDEPGKYKFTINMLDGTYQIEAVSFDPFIYYIGATDGWNNNEPNRQKLALADATDGTYTGYIYCADPNGWGNQFKFQRVAGSWDNEINASVFSSFEGSASNEGGNIGVKDGESVYYFEVKLATGKITATKVSTMGIIGVFNEWGGDVVMTWNASEYCYEATNAGMTTEGWKFRINSDWGINLGGTLTNLVANGDNLAVEGNTVKLYPTRRDNDNIYCTVK